MKRKAEAKEMASELAAKKTKEGSGAAGGALTLTTYWESPEAKKLFLGHSTDERDVVDVLQQRIERLQQVNRTPDGWREVIDKHDRDNHCSSYDIFFIRQRCSILCLAYTYALEEMNAAKWVEDCCAQAVNDCNRMGIEAAATNERTVAGWNILLRGNREHFPLPSRKQKKPLPELLELFQEEITLPWLEYCIENLADLTVELA
jgi:Zn-finger protein